MTPYTKILGEVRDRKDNLDVLVLETTKALESAIVRQAVRRYDLLHDRLYALLVERAHVETTIMVLESAQKHSVRVESVPI